MTGCRRRHDKAALQDSGVLWFGLRNLAGGNCVLLRFFITFILKWRRCLRDLRGCLRDFRGYLRDLRGCLARLASPAAPQNPKIDWAQKIVDSLYAFIIKMTIFGPSWGVPYLAICSLHWFTSLKYRGLALGFTNRAPLAGNPARQTAKCEP